MTQMTAIHDRGARLPSTETVSPLLLHIVNLRSSQFPEFPRSILWERWLLLVGEDIGNVSQKLSKSSYAATQIVHNGSPGSH